MMKAFFAAAFLTVAALRPAFAAVTYNDLWWNPAESGWGITFAQQGNTIFATWFIFGADNKATWAVATLQNSVAAPTTFTGQLFTVTGPAFSMPFVSSAIAASQAGAATLSFNDTNHATLSYTLGGSAPVIKSIQRQNLVALPLAGQYEGKTFGTGVFNSDSTTYIVTTTGASINIVRSAFFAGTCRYDGSYTQFGTRVTAAGNYQCSDFSTGQWGTDDITVVDERYLLGTIFSTQVTPRAQPTFAQRFMGAKSQ